MGNKYESGVERSSFIDREGREWSPVLDFGKVKAIREQTGLDLSDAQSIGRTWAIILSDDAKTIDAVWLAIGPVSSPTKDEWLSAMDGAVLEKAVESLRGAMELFIRPHRRQLMREGVDAVNDAYSRMMKEAGAQIRQAVGPAVEQAMEISKRGIESQLAAPNG